jgi:hypothetical protein
MHSVEEREAAIAHMAQSEEWISALRAHVQEIVEGEAFKGSGRCGRFLSYIVNQSIAGHFESLKERMIGLELFDRSPDYDTGEDAIVRVTASDVRKRLLQHYGKYGAASEFHISLPLGSYIPEITYEAKNKAVQSVTGKPRDDLHTTVPSAVTSQPGLPLDSKPAVEQAFTGSSMAEPETALSNRSNAYRWLVFAAVLVVLNVAFWGLVWRRTPRLETPGGSAPALVLPWTVLLNSTHSLHLITSDPDIAAIQRLTQSRISVSNYANQNYLPEDTSLTPEMKKICLTLLRGDKAAAQDLQIAVSVTELARNSSKKIDVQVARSFQFSNLKTDDNFIFLGSPYSDPWFSVFNDLLDFRIYVDPDSKEEAIRNVHPRANEEPLYTPTARGGATGQSFAIVSFIGNPDQDGQVLLLAGLDGEGTQAAGKLVTDLPRLSTALQNCGIAPSGPLKHFEMLLRVNTMAGYPSQFDVVACHILPGA